MATITAKGPNKTPKTLRGISERNVDAEIFALEAEGYSRISVTYPEFKRKPAPKPYCGLLR